jgi:hypothetical protein
MYRTAPLFDASRSALLLRVGPAGSTDLGTIHQLPPNTMPAKELMTDGPDGEPATWGC